MAVKRSPVVGVAVMQLKQATAAKSMVSAVSFGAHRDPCTRTPPMHSARIVCGPGRTVPVRSAPAGFRIV
jgi:hypothetical protein